MASRPEMGLTDVLRWVIACDDPEHLLSIIETASACLDRSVRLSQLRWEAKTYRENFAKVKREARRQPRDRRRVLKVRIAKNF